MLYFHIKRPFYIINVIYNIIDLLLAAEIGQALLEKNKELELALKSTQEYAEEQAEQAKVKIVL